MKDKLKSEVKDCLINNILPYWIDKMVDPEGGFYGRRDGNDVLDPDAPKGAILNGRLLWTFSAAYRVVGDPKYLEMATRAKREIIDRFYDPEFGGIYWSLDSKGNPLDTKKQFYAIGFAIYGLSEYVRATGDEEALEYAKKLFHAIEDHSRDREKNGYIEALTRDWQPIADMRLSDKDENSSKTMNTHLHIIEPYANLLRVWDDPELREATRNLLELFLDRIMLPDKRGHMGLFFDNDWHPEHAGTLSYGHDVEASWLLLETAQVLAGGDASASPGSPIDALYQRTLRETKRMAEAALEGRCVDGSMVYERFANGRYDDDKHWWVQAECAIGQYYLYVFHDMPEMLEKAYQTWRYIADNIVDREGGEWHWSRKGTEINRADDKAGFWKCPYHNSRMCLEIMTH